MRKFQKEPTEIINIRIPVSIKKQIEEMRGNRRGVTRTEIIRAALKVYFDPTEADKKEIALLRRLEAMDRQLTQIKAQNEAIAECLAVFTRAYFTDMIALRGATGINQESINSARQKTDAVFTKFLKRIGENLNLGGQFFRNIPDQIFDPSQFVSREIDENKIQGEHL